MLTAGRDARFGRADDSNTHCAASAHVTVAASLVRGVGIIAIVKQLGQRVLARDPRGAHLPLEKTDVHASELC